MSDYDRGAYTPQTDAPLAFDPRRPSERRPLPMALIGSAAVLVILLAGVAMVYRGGVRHAGESPRPVGEPVLAVKTAPNTSPSTTAAPPANADIFTESQSANTVASASNATGPSTAAPAPTFAPPAEQPAQRPQPSAATVAMLARPSAPSHIIRPPTPAEGAARPQGAAPGELATTTAPRAAKPTTPAHAALHTKLDQAELAAAGGTRTAPEASSATTDADAPAPVHKPVKLAASRSADAPAATGVEAGPAKAVVQIGAFSSTALADKGYADVSAALPDQMAGKAKHVQPLDKDGTTLYRTWLSGFATRADAQAFCEALKAKGKTCLVKG